MKRLIFDILAAVSLVLLVVTAMFWMRCYHTSDGWRFLTTGSGGAATQYEPGFTRAKYTGIEFGWCQEHFGIDYFSIDGEDVSVFRSGLSPVQTHWSFYPPYAGPTDSVSDWEALGLSGATFKVDQRRGQTVTGSNLVVPPSWPTIIAIWLPIIWVYYWWRGRVENSRRNRGLCVRCGYDLRASPGRCSECGHVQSGDKTRIPNAQAIPKPEFPN